MTTRVIVQSRMMLQVLAYTAGLGKQIKVYLHLNSNMPIAYPKEDGKVEIEFKSLEVQKLHL